MEAVKKIIGLIIVIGIIFLLINARKFLPSLNKIALGGASKTPAEIGTSYIDQIEKMTPKIDYGGGKPYTGSSVGYGSFVAANYGATSYGGAGSTIAPAVTTTKGRATLEKNHGQLTLYVENIQTTGTAAAHIWLANTAMISNQTEYVDFGVVKNGKGIQMYGVRLNSGDLDISIFKYLIVVDPKTFTVYGTAVLGR